MKIFPMGRFIRIFILLWSRDLTTLCVQKLSIKQSLNHMVFVDT